MIDAYNILGLNKDANTIEIKKSYRSLAKKWHPDKNKSKNAEDKFKEINEAYIILIDTNKRIEHDKQFNEKTIDFNFNYGAVKDFINKRNPFYNWSEGKNPFNTNDIPKGDNIIKEITVSSGNVYKNISYERKGKCIKCEGSGGEDIGGIFLVCITCIGSGVQQEIYDIDVHIKKEILSGHRLTFKGHGHYEKKSLYGDLILLIIRINDDTEDTYKDVYIPFYKMIYGGNLDVQTDKGMVTIKLKPYSECGQRLRMLNKGINGDFIIKLMVKIPDSLNLNKKEEKILKLMQKEKLFI